MNDERNTLEELHSYAQSNASRDEMPPWVEQLSPADRLLVIAECKRVVKRLMEVWWAVLEERGEDE